MTSCTHLNKHGLPCGNAAVRRGLCIYHQPSEKVLRLLLKLERNRREGRKIAEQIQEASK